LLLGAGFALRALDQLVARADGAPRPGLDALTPLLYCIGFAYALLGMSSARIPMRLHVAAACLAAGGLLAAQTGKTPIVLALFAGGAGLMMLVMGQAALRSESSFRRVALLVAAGGSGLFALHAFLYLPGEDLLQARLVRLGATAAMALPLLAALHRSHAGGTSRATRLAQLLSAIGMVALPLVLVLSAFVDQRLKYALAPASDCFAVALLIACVQAGRGGDREALAGFGTVLASMVLGKAMGFYAFEGPLTAPAALTAYDDAWRVALRNFHIDLMALGFALLLWPSLVRPTPVTVAALAIALGLCTPAMGPWSQWAGAATVMWLIFFWRGRAIA
jgi:hypothetical protein